MAVVLSEKDVLSLPVQPLTDLQLRTGDLYFCMGDQLSSRIIKWYTKSVWSHCGLVWIPDSVSSSTTPLFIEAAKWQGVRVCESGRYLADTKHRLYEGPVVFARYRYYDGNKSSRISMDRAIKHGLSQLSDAYNSVDLIYIVWQAIMKGGWRLRGWLGKRGWICSELVAACLQEAGCYLDRKEKLISPGGLWGHPNIYMLGRVA